MKLKCANGPIEDETRGLLILLLILPSFLHTHSLTHSPNALIFSQSGEATFASWANESAWCVRVRCARVREGRAPPRPTARPRPPAATCRTSKAAERELIWRGGK